MKKKSRKSTRKAEASAVLIEQVKHPNAAGIDCGAHEMVVAVPESREGTTVRTFRTFTADLRQMRDWLLADKIATVAIESTGNYWITAYQLMEEAGIEIFLVNARHVKGVPGKKTDCCDARWLQQLHAAGLLRKSFRPAVQIAQIRYTMRHRSKLVASSSQALLRMQKVLTEMNLKLHHVFSDIDGISALTIIEAILKGERNPERLAAMRDRRCKAPLAKVLKSLEGDYRPEYLLVLEQEYNTWKHFAEQIARIDAELAKMVGEVKVVNAPQDPLPQPARKQQHTLRKNSPLIDPFTQGWRFFGVDLSTIDGVSASLISSLITEVGTREQMLAAFPTGAHFASWLALCPDNRISGGRVLSARTRKVVNPLATTFRLCAHALQHSHSRLGEYVRKMKARLGKAPGITAGAHKLARIVYTLILKQEPYNESQAFAETPHSRSKKLSRLRKFAQELGYSLTELQPLTT